MKRSFTWIFILFVTSVLAQPAPTDVKYKRSSLYTLMITGNQQNYADDIQESFLSYPIPDKFNDHNLPNRLVTATDTSKDQSGAINHFISTNSIAKSLVAKWFNRNEKGEFDMNMISERGFYNASEMDVNRAKANKRGTALLADAGEELIGNTFVLISDFKYVSKEEVAGKAKEGLAMAGSLAGRFGVRVSDNVSTLTDSALTIGGKGYVVKTTSYLYRLDWNDSIAAVFYNEYWTDKSGFDPAKKAAFDKSDIFTLHYIGSEIAWADLQSSS